MDLEQAIAAEFKNCGLPQYQECTSKFLEQGKLLILLDGLDEVPNARTREMVTKIQNFVDRYSQNRFIVSCRIAAYRHNFTRFTDVAIADFDDREIETFITNWFHYNPERGKECREKLQAEGYEATKELAQTPLLLTLICLVYQRGGQFPVKRASLYEKALRVLLEEWNAAKEIPQEQLYKGLDTKAKESMLAQIAWDTFKDDYLFFQRGRVIKKIEELSKEILPSEESINGGAILRDIEVQHGLLVERAQSIYSFSHLTMQEFLTAQNICDDDHKVEELVKKYLCDERWREVFLLLAGLKKKADKFLLMIEKQVQTYVVSYKLQNLLAWVEEVTDTSEGDIRPLGKRAAVLGYVRVLIRTVNKIKTTLITIRNERISYTYSILTIDTSSKTTIDSDKYYDFLFGINDIINDLYDSDVSDDFLEYVEWLEKYKVYKSVDFPGLISSLEKLKQQTRDNNQLGEGCQRLHEKTIEILLQAFHLDLKIIDLSQEEYNALDNYLYGICLLLNCKEEAVRVSSATWEKIEQRMLLPHH